MRKIKSLFRRDYEGTCLCYDEVVEGCEWAAAGEGLATRKWDGTACLWKGGKLWKRYDAKRGRKPPDDFVPAMDPDPVTGHHAGWVPVGDGPEDRWHREAMSASWLRDGHTYELCGPKVRGNPEGLATHVLIEHGAHVLPDVPRSFAGLKAWLSEHADIEGIVFHHRDGRMCKVKLSDFGIRRNARAEPHLRGAASEGVK